MANPAAGFGIKVSFWEEVSQGPDGLFRPDDAKQFSRQIVSESNESSSAAADGAVIEATQHAPLLKSASGDSARTRSISDQPPSESANSGLSSTRTSFRKPQKKKGLAGIFACFAPTQIQ
jgi:hypothetical protein